MQKALEVLKKYFGYDAFRQGQDTLVSSILSGKDAFGIMPTGAGKSICYQVPALMLSGITIVVSPLISLMKDQVKALNDVGVYAAYINSSLTEGQIVKALSLAAKGRFKIVYVAPERLESREFLWFVDQVEISMVTIDEAHCISQWGQDFRPSYLNIVKFIDRFAVRPVVSAFTATATKEVRQDILCVLGLHAPEVVVTGFDRENLYFGVETPSGKDDFVLRYVREHKVDSGIIYCATRKNVDKLYEKLLAQGIPVTKYHAGLSNAARQENQDDFIYDRKPVIVATNAFGMGIDKSNVRYVLHYNMPQSMENYYQEAGRAGRDGEPAECILLYSGQDVVVNRYLLEQKVFDAEMTREDIEAVRQRDETRLRRMAAYCAATDCLRSYILGYFGEEADGTCGNCSSCQREYEEVDRTEEAKKVLFCVSEAKGRYGTGVIAGTLSGSRRGKLKDYGCMEYESYGALKDLTEKEIGEIISWLVMHDYLKRTEDKYGLLRAGGRADALLDDEDTILMRVPKAQKGSDGSMDVTTAGQRKTMSVDLNNRGFELFDNLRTLRLELARQENVPPYIVFNDRTLVNMCVSVPLTKEEMLQVSGVGENKFEKYGDRFLKEITSFTDGKKEKLYFGDGFSEDGQAAAIPYTGSRNRGKKEPFALTSAQAENFPFAESYRAPEIAEAMYALVDKERFKRVSGADIYRWVEKEGLAGEKYENGRRVKFVTEAGEGKGIFLETRISKKGNEYLDLFYDRRAQKMIVEKFISG